MADDPGLVSYEDLAAIEDEFAEIDTEICKDLLVAPRGWIPKLIINQCGNNTI